MRSKLVFLVLSVGILMAVGSFWGYAQDSTAINQADQTLSEGDSISSQRRPRRLRVGPDSTIAQREDALLQLLQAAALDSGDTAFTRNTLQPALPAPNGLTVKGQPSPQIPRYVLMVSPRKEPERAPLYALAAGFVCLALLRARSPGTLRQIFTSLLDRRQAEIAFREQPGSITTQTLFADLTFFLAGSLVAFEWLQFGWLMILPPGVRFGTLFLTLMGFYLLQAQIVRSTLCAMNKTEHLSFYLWNTLAYQRGLGVALLGPLLFSVVGPLEFQAEALMVCTAVTAFFLLARWLRGAQIAVGLMKISGLGYVLFLLAIEAVPLMLLVRYMLFGWPRG